MGNKNKRDNKAGSNSQAGTDAGNGALKTPSHNPKPSPPLQSTQQSVKKPSTNGKQPQRLATGDASPSSKDYAGAARNGTGKGGSSSNGGGSSNSGGGDPSNRFAALGEENSPSKPTDGGREEGEIPPDDPTRALAADVLANLQQAATTAAPSIPAPAGNFLAPFIISSLEQARDNKEEPEPWIMRLVLGAPVQDATLTQVASPLQQSLAGSQPQPNVAPLPQHSGDVSQQQQQNNLAIPTHEQRTRATQDTFRALKASEFPPTLKLEGLPSEDVPEIMAQYRTHIRLSLPENTSDDIIDRRAIKNLRLITKGAAAQSLDLILSSHLEWRSEQQLKLHTGELENRVNQLEKLINTQGDTHVSSAARGRSNSRGPTTQKRGPSQPQIHRNQKAKVAFTQDTKSSGGTVDGGSGSKGGVECTYPGCAGKSKRFTHSRQECRTEKRDLQNGIKYVSVTSQQG
ncbi:unnamed protein product [Ectocarpus sp. CCAP 1310/34]|nr:unnamed protein product [Ectocarpus sp. CCAP 1310/34]